MIYFLQAASGGPVKIGHSCDEKQRRMELQIGNPNDLVLIRVIDGYDLVEAWLHKRFREQYIRGEWFDFTDEMLSVEAPIALVEADEKDAAQRLVVVADAGVDFYAAFQDARKLLGATPAILNRAADKLLCEKHGHECLWFAERGASLSRAATQRGDRDGSIRHLEEAAGFLALAREWKRRIDDRR